MNHIFIARQPIYDREVQVQGYELLFRGEDTGQADIGDADLATTSVLRNCFMDFGLEKLVGDTPAFVNATRNLLTSSQKLPYPPRRLVLEIPDSLEPNAELLEAVRQMRGEGYRFALDNFLYSDAWQPFLELVDIVKINIQGAAPGTVARQVELLVTSPCRLLALRVESPEEYVACREMGFDLFQGFFFCRPEVVRGRKLPASRLSTMRLLAQLQSPECDLKGLERIISQDVSLSYRLLRYLNSVQFGLIKEIDSISHAIGYLGLDNLRVWASVILLARIDEKPVELMKTSLIRGKMCELLGKSSGSEDPNLYFMVGLFSTLEGLLDTPLDEVLGDLPLSDEIKQALLSYEGAAGEAMNCALAYERGEWEYVDHSPYSAETVTRSYLQAVEWADATISEVAGN